MTRVSGAAAPTTQPIEPRDSVVTLLNDSTTIAAEFGGDPQAQLAAMVLKFANERREQARGARSLAEDQIREAQARQVDKLHDQADDLRRGAWVGAVTGIAAGAMEFASGCALAGSASNEAVSTKGLDQVRQACPDRLADAPANLANAKNAEATANAALSKKWGAGSMILGAVSQTSSRVFDSLAQDDAADATAEGHRAQAAERMLEDINDSVDDANDMEDAALDFLDQANETEAATEQAYYIRA
jgi:hypothetical protein